MSLNILDCSLRDGGYYNLWNFRLKSVREYISKVSEANIKFIEIGFRFFKKNSKFGNLAFSEDQYIKKLKVNKKISLAVMLNGSDIVNLRNQWKFFLNKIFPNQKESQIKIIRINKKIN
jgi:4-hydroxy 2-oxovalerate aldolase